MWLLLFCSVLAGAVFLERALYFHRVTLVLGEFLRGLAELIRHKRWAEAQVEGAGNPTPVTRVLHAAVLRHSAPRAELKEIVQEAGQLEVPRLEKNLGLLAGLGLISPLLGLLGTVTGMIEVFMIGIYFAWLVRRYGTLLLPISATFPFERLGDAFAMMKANLHFGKIVVTVA